jgi:branched-chain amino acid transport system substrate-binding protein
LEKIIVTLASRSAYAVLSLALLLTVAPVQAQKNYGPGASDNQIKLGQSTPLSGPASAFGAGAGRAVLGYFDMLNEQGGTEGCRAITQAG